MGQNQSKRVLTTADYLESQLESARLAGIKPPTEYVEIPVLRDIPYFVFLAMPAKEQERLLAEGLAQWEVEQAEAAGETAAFCAELFVERDELKKKQKKLTEARDAAVELTVRKKLEAAEKFERERVERERMEKESEEVEKEEEEKEEKVEEKPKRKGKKGKKGKKGGK